jgi:hypothetical protein
VKRNEKNGTQLIECSIVDYLLSIVISIAISTYIIRIRHAFYMKQMGSVVVVRRYPWVRWELKFNKKFDKR